MGMYDEIHAGTRCGQSKAFGRRHSIVIGDLARLVPALSAAQAEANEEEVADATTDFQIAAPQGGFIIVRASLLTGWDDFYDASLPLYENYGHPLDPEHVNPDGTMPESYLWWDAEKVAFEAARRAGMDSEVDRLIAQIFGAPTPPGLGPHSDAVEIAERLNAVSLFDDEDVRAFQGLPGDCPVCAAVRAGTVQEYRTRQRQEREQT